MKSSNYKNKLFSAFFFKFSVYKRKNQDSETIMIPFDVFLNYTHCLPISAFYLYFYYEKTPK